MATPAAIAAAVFAQDHLGKEIDISISWLLCSSGRNCYPFVNLREQTSGLLFSCLCLKLGRLGLSGHQSQLNLRAGLWAGVAGKQTHWFCFGHDDVHREVQQILWVLHAELFQHESTQVIWCHFTLRHPYAVELLLFVKKGDFFLTLF